MASSNGKAPGKSVSLSPDAFSTEQLDLSKLPLEEVVAQFRDIERKRTPKTEPENEAEVRWRVRSAPPELLSSLRVVSAHLGVSVALLTRCMSRHMADWYANALDLSGLASEYGVVYAGIQQATYTTLRIQAERPAAFSFVRHEEEARTSISTISWVVRDLSERREPLGLSFHDMFMLGLIWSLTTLEHREWNKRAIERFFSPEVYNLETFVAERRIDVDALKAKFERRESTGYNDHIFIRESQADYSTSSTSPN